MILYTINQDGFAYFWIVYSLKKSKFERFPFKLLCDFIFVTFFQTSWFILHEVLRIYSKSSLIFWEFYQYHLLIYRFHFYKSFRWFAQMASMSLIPNKITEIFCNKSFFSDILIDDLNYIPQTYFKNIHSSKNKLNNFPISNISNIFEFQNNLILISISYNLMQFQL